MKLFKIKLTPVVKERGWEVKHIRKNKKHKVCAICKKEMPIGSPSTTFTKRTSVGSTTKYEVKHVCPATTPMEDCIVKLGKQLNINVADCWVN